MVASGTLQEAASAVPLAVTLLFFGLLVAGLQIFYFTTMKSYRHLS